MRTNIEIDDSLMDQAMKAGPYKTKKDAVEAGLKLLARQAAYREVLKWRGKLKWEGDDAIDWTKSSHDEAAETRMIVAEPTPPRQARTRPEPPRHVSPPHPTAAKARRAGR